MFVSSFTLSASEDGISYLLKALVALRSVLHLLRLVDTWVRASVLDHLLSWGPRPFTLDLNSVEALAVVVNSFLETLDRDTRSLLPN